MSRDKYCKVMFVCIVFSFLILTGRKVNMIKFWGFRPQININMNINYSDQFCFLFGRFRMQILA